MHLVAARHVEILSTAYFAVQIFQQLQNFAERWPGGGVLAQASAHGFGVCQGALVGQAGEGRVLDEGAGGSRLASPQLRGVEGGVRCGGAAQRRGRNFEIARNGIKDHWPCTAHFARGQPPTTAPSHAPCVFRRGKERIKNGNENGGQGQLPWGHSARSYKSPQNRLVPMHATKNHPENVFSKQQAGDTLRVGHEYASYEFPHDHTKGIHVALSMQLVAAGDFGGGVEGRALLHVAGVRLAAGHARGQAEVGDLHGGCAARESLFHCGACAAVELQQHHHQRFLMHSQPRSHRVCSSLHSCAVAKVQLSNRG